MNSKEDIKESAEIEQLKVLIKEAGNDVRKSNRLMMKNHIEKINQAVKEKNAKP